MILLHVEIPLQRFLLCESYKLALSCFKCPPKAAMPNNLTSECIKENLSSNKFAIKQCKKREIGA